MYLLYIAISLGVEIGECLSYNGTILNKGVRLLTGEIIWALTPVNLAAIGAVDDFYDLYVSIKEIYTAQWEQFIETNGESKTLFWDQWNKLCKKEVRRACEPVMNRYLHIFADGYTKIFANAYGFQVFDFLNIKRQKGRSLTFDMYFVSFADFLVQLQIAVTRIIHNWKLQDQPKYAFERIQEEINNHILAYVQNNTAVKMLPDEETAQVTQEVLYIYENLSSTNCYINKHPVNEDCFVADFAVGSGKIVLPVHYCQKCKKHFIGRTTLELFEKNYGKLLIQRKQLDETENLFASFNMESYLHQLGYNVSDGRTDRERQTYLVMLLKNNKITYWDMVRCIELNIRTHSNKPVAVEKWKKDLKFIGDYIVQKDM